MSNCRKKSLKKKETHSYLELRNKRTGDFVLNLDQKSECAFITEFLIKNQYHVFYGISCSVLCLDMRNDFQST